MVELLVAMAISLMIMAAAVYVYIASSDSQRVLDRNTASNETGVFAMQMLGRAIMNSGFYPAPSPPIPVDVTQTGMYDTYPPIPATKRAVTDWANPEANWPPPAFQTGIYGCDGAKLNPSSSSCGDSEDGGADTLVINYFTVDAMGAHLAPVSTVLEPTWQGIPAIWNATRAPQGGMLSMATRRDCRCSVPIAIRFRPVWPMQGEPK
nr:hypothetical protein [Delftia acidovorans]